MSISFETLALAQKSAKDYIDAQVISGGGKSKSMEIILSTNWQGQSPNFSQVITIAQTNEKTKVDLVCNDDTYAALAADGVEMLYVTNNNGVLTAHAIGNKPTTELKVQATILEVIV